MARIMTPQDKAERARRHLDDELSKIVHAELREMLVSELEREADIDRQTEIVRRLQIHRQTRQMYERYASQLLVDAHERKQESFIERATQTLKRYRA